MKLNVFGPAFGDDPQVREDASPIKHVRPGLPPFLLFYADHDLPTIPGMTQEMHQALQEQGCESSLCEVEHRNHNSIIFRAIKEEDPVGQGMLAFIRRLSGS